MHPFFYEVQTNWKKFYYWCIYVCMIQEGQSNELIINKGFTHLSIEINIKEI